MLLNNFFEIAHINAAGNSLHAEIKINAAHKIFEGHFPGQPVVPGVCMLQIIKEILEQVMQQKNNLVKAMDIKFLAVIDPVQNNLINASIQYSLNEEGHTVVNAYLFKNELVHFKFKGLFA
jgi:3-hydroxyacyl-[acyl-carrier-protein] dehydratase